MNAGRALRVTRAAVFAGLCVLLAASGHVVASGAVVSAGSLLLAFAGCGAGAWLFGRRERGPGAVVGAALGTQALLHLVFSAGQTRCPATPGAVWPLLCGRHSGPAAGPAAGLSHPDPHDAAAQALAGPPADALSGGMAANMADAGHGVLPGGSFGMLAAHAAVALLGALWLGRGERAVFRLLRWAALRVLPLPPRACHTRPAPARPAVPRPDRDAPAPRRPAFVRSLWSRGPPARPAVTATARRHGRGSPA